MNNEITIFKQFLIDNKQKLSVFNGYKNRIESVEIKCKCFNNSIERIKCFIIDLYNDICNDIIEYKIIKLDFFIYDKYRFIGKKEIKKYFNNNNIDLKILLSLKPIKTKIYKITKINNQL
jgi:hypothetical protein